MKSRYIFAALLFSISLPCSPAQASERQRDLVGNILRRFPEYHLLTLQERDRTTRAYLAKHHTKRNPSLVQADFDGDGNSDCALLLKSNKSPATKLVVALCPGEGQCRTVKDEDLTAYSEIVFLTAVPIGSRVSQTDAIPANSSQKSLVLTGIRITYFEKAKVVLYWSKKHKKMEEVQTAD